MRAGHACLVCGTTCRGSCVDLVLEVALGEELAQAQRELAQFGGWGPEDVFDPTAVDADDGSCS